MLEIDVEPLKVVAIEVEVRVSAPDDAVVAARARIPRLIAAVDGAEQPDMGEVRLRVQTRRIGVSK